MNNGNIYESVANYYKNASNKYNAQPHNIIIPKTITIPAVEQMNTTQEIYQKYPKLKDIQQLVNIDSDCPIDHKLYTHTTEYKNSMNSSFDNSADIEGWFKLIVNHCFYILYLVKNQYHPSISYDFLRQVYSTYSTTMGSLMLSHYDKQFEEVVKNHKQYLLNNDKAFRFWLKKKYSNVTHRLNNLEIRDMHEFVFWSKDIFDGNDIVTHFLPNKVKMLYQKYEIDLLETIKPKTKKQWNAFLTEFDNVFQTVVWHLASKESDPLYLSHIKEDDTKKQEVIAEIIADEKFLLLSKYAYEILLCANLTALESIKQYFNMIPDKTKLSRRNLFFAHLKNTINQKIVEPNTFTNSLSTAKILDIYIILFTKLDELQIEVFGDIFRESLYPILEILQKRPDIFILLSYCFYNDGKITSEDKGNFLDHNDLDLLDKFRSLIANDKSLSATTNNLAVANKDVASWFKNNYLHNKLYAEETLKVPCRAKTFGEYVSYLSEVKYNLNIYAKQESVIMQVINSLACTDKEKFLASFTSTYHDYLLGCCDRDTDDWKYPFSLLLKILFKGGVDDSAEHTESAVKTMILDMAVNTQDFGKYAYNEGNFNLVVLANEYWNLPKTKKYKELLSNLVISQNTIFKGLIEKYKDLHNGQQLYLSGQKSTMVVNLEFDDGRRIHKRCSLIQGTLINFISQHHPDEFSIEDIRKTKEFGCFSEHEISDALKIWENIGVLHRLNNDTYHIIEDLDRFNSLHQDKPNRKRVLDIQENLQNNKKALKTDSVKEDKLTALDEYFEKFVVSALEARQGGLSALEIRDWLMAAMPDFVKKMIPKLKKSAKNDDEITIEDYANHLVRKGELKKSKTGLYHRRYK